MDSSKTAHDFFDYVIFHKNCLDGFSGFFVLTSTDTISDSAIIYPDVPSAKEAPPNISGKNVIIIDVAYKKEVLEQIFQEARRVLFIDHHVTIRSDVLQLITIYGDRHAVVYDSSKSGASLTWSYFYPNKKVPWFIKYIEDNDIGAWKYKHTMDFILGLQVNYPLDISSRTISKWGKLLNNNEVRRLIKIGNKYSEYENYLLDINSKRYTLELFPSEKLYEDFRDFFEKPGQYKVAVVNGSGCPSTSLLGKRIVTDVDCDFCIIWSLHLDKKEMVISFRSKSTDVGEIARLFGAGGHKYASACSIPISRYTITDMFFPESLPRSRRR
jgi:nanoRNase/pAp phosphatase (c-di-AMP/oligoRNAs hydrolase)